MELYCSVEQININNMFVNVQEKPTLNLKFLISGGEIHRKPN